MSFDKQKESLLRFGVVYVLKYLGSIEVLCSMRELHFDERRSLIRECVREVAGRSEMAVSGKTHRSSSTFSEFVTNKMLSKDVDMFLSGIEVLLTVTVDNLVVARKDTKQTFVSHRMELVSFASGGDQNTPKCIAYVAKDESNRRVCYVLQSLNGLESMIISTIGQAFDLKYSDSLKANEDTEKVQSEELHSPTKTKHRISENGSRPYLHTHFDRNDRSTPSSARKQSSREHGKERDNQHRGQPFYDRESCSISPHHRIVRSTQSPNQQRLDRLNSSGIPVCKDSTQLPRSSGSTSNISRTHLGQVNSPSDSNAADNLESELWFHGNISRATAEELVRKNGDFLVRQCTQIPGQYVLTGKYDNQPKHLLLVDPNGVVRTRECKFDSISHLIYHHQQKHISIVSPDSELMLLNPIIRAKP